MSDPRPTNQERLNGVQTQSSPQLMTRDRVVIQRETRPIPSSPTMLDLEASSVLRDQLAAELKGIGSVGEAATWAHQVLAQRARWSRLTPKK
jgi:hypothetical protein